ncbi:MAG: CoB--CoM heterodisulfide reductase iron-sulfur subunit B family protein [Candidatus Thermoplasmatota archaeon]|nr:CoB--CoM heterodisulfide reductase iron-sulfur subunit B family protein [Candidatus Thermoplasmatota archaeon]
MTTHMKYALYPGCLMPTEQYAYELSLRESLPVLQVQLVDVPEFSCCGEPMKSVNQLLSLYLAARNIALAEQQQLDLYAPCAMCHLALSECKHILDHNTAMRERINTLLSAENLTYTGSQQVVHTIDLLYDHIGIEKIKQQVKHPLKGWKLAVHYGCHAIRPKEIGRPDDSEHPLKIEAILRALGAEPVEDYPEKLDCCGAPLLANLPESALTKTGQKLQAIQHHGIQGLVDVCPWCHKMFDARQTKAGETIAAKLDVPVFYLTQLLGLAFGLPAEKLGLHLNQSPVEKLTVEGGA